MRGKPDVEHELRAQAYLVKIAGIQVAIYSAHIQGLLLQQPGRLPERAGAGCVVAEAPRIGDHADKERLGGHRGQPQAVLHGQPDNQAAAAFAAGIYRLQLGNLPGEQVVVDARGGLCQRIAPVADEPRRGRIQDDGHGIAIGFVRHVVHHGIFHKIIPSRAVADHIYLLAGKVFPEKVFQANLAAQRIAVRVGMAVQDDAFMCGNGLKNGLKHGIPSFVQIGAGRQAKYPRYSTRYGLSGNR